MTMAQQLLKTLIAAYQAIISPLLGPRCRYHPTCSDYMSQAIEQHGALHGAWLGIKRLARCHPWAEGGHDPIPCPLPSCARAHAAPQDQPSSLTRAKAES